MILCVVSYPSGNRLDGSAWPISLWYKIFLNGCLLMPLRHLNYLFPFSCHDSWEATGFSHATGLPSSLYILFNPSQVCPNRSHCSFSTSLLGYIVFIKSLLLQKLCIGHVVRIICRGISSLIPGLVVFMWNFESKIYNAKLIFLFL